MMDTPGYEQAAQDLIKLYGVGFALGQAGKKAQESQRMTTPSAVIALEAQATE